MMAHTFLAWLVLIWQGFFPQVRIPGAGGMAPGGGGGGGTPSLLQWTCSDGNGSSACETGCGGSTSCSATLPGNTTNPSTIWLVLRNQYGNTPTATACGNAMTMDVNDSTTQIIIFRLKNTFTGPCMVTANLDWLYSPLVVLETSNPNAGDYDNSAAGTGSGTAASIGPETLSGSNDGLVAAFNVPVGSTIPTSCTGVTVVNVNSADYWWVGFGAVSNGSYTLNCSGMGDGYTNWYGAWDAAK
jgi:hypothetical protein